MRHGPERELVSRYLERFAKAGPQLGITFAGITEILESRASSLAERQREEAGKLRAFSGDDALVLLDEGGRSETSHELASRLSRFRDGGRRVVVFAIGGPDGHDPGLRANAELILSFGSATWPHQLVRVMLAEQLYRAATILSGHPYHRG